jgi:membrane fusion protein (multidrug efflux system)
VPRSGGGRSWLGWLLAALVIGGVVWAKFHFFPSTNTKGGGKGGVAAGPKGGAGGAKAAKTPVGVFVVAATRLSDEVASTGSVLAEAAVTIRSEIAGRITSLNFKEGQKVSKGQLLFTINADETRAALQKQAYNIKLYQDQEKRERTLLEKEYISQQEYEQANNQLLTARADQASLQATLVKSNVRAPFSGQLGLSTTTVGTYVSPNTPIVTLAQTRPVKIDFGVPGRFASQVKIGDTVRVTDEASAKQYAAKVYAINPQLDPVSRTLQARARFANTHDELQPGAFVKVSLELGQTADALQIPTEAVVPVASGYQVFVIQKGKVVAKDVKIGARSAALIQITQGLAVGDSIVRTGVLQVKVGDAVVVN